MTIYQFTINHEPLTMKLPTEPQLTSEILEGGVKLFLFCFPKILPLVLVDVFLSILLHLYMPQLNTLEYTAIIATMMDTSITLFLYMMAVLILHTAIFYRIGAIINQFDGGNFDALLQGIKKLLPILLATGFYTVFVGMGLMIVIPGVILAVSLQFYTPLILFEDTTVIESLQRSHKLVWNNWFRTATVLAIPLLFSMSLALILSGVIEGLLGGSFTKEQIELAMQLTYLTIDRLFIPFFYAIILLQYYDLKRRSKQSIPTDKYFIA
jgi:hypothetical protein